MLGTSVLMASISFVAGVTTFNYCTTDGFCGAAVVLGTIAMKWPLSQLPVNSMRSGSPIACPESFPNSLQICLQDISNNIALERV